MHLEQDVYELRQRVNRLERQVDLLMKRLNLTYTDPPDPTSEEILALLQQGRKIAAIKLYREMTGAGLKAAKQFVEALERDHFR